MDNRRRNNSKKGLSKINYKIIDSSNKNDKSRSKSKKKMKLRYKIPLIIGISIISIIIIIALSVYLYARSKLSKMQYEPINKDGLGINENLHDEIDTDLTKSEFNQIINIALFGSDSRDINNVEAGRSDSIMVASLNPIKKNVKLISIPRDTYVSINGYGKTKINHAYAYGAEQLSIRTINENFGLNIDKYVTINFEGLINVIKKIGGVELDITEAELKVLNQYLAESYSVSGKTYTPMTTYGHVTLNGEQALAHSRNRYVGSDFTRASRQRDIIEAAAKKIANMSKTKILELSDYIFECVKTNITPEEFMGIFLANFADIGTYANNIISAQVPSTSYAQGQYISGVYYFVPDLDKAKTDFQDYLYNK